MRFEFFIIEPPFILFFWILETVRVLLSFAGFLSPSDRLIISKNGGGVSNDFVVLPSHITFFKSWKGLQDYYFPQDVPPSPGVINTFIKSKRIQNVQKWDFGGSQVSSGKLYIR